MGAYQSRALDRPDELSTGELFISLCASPRPARCTDHVARSRGRRRAGPDPDRPGARHVRSDERAAVRRPSSWRGTAPRRWPATTASRRGATTSSTGSVRPASPTACSRSAAQWADLRFLDLSLDPSDRPVGCYAGDPAVANRGAFGLASACSLRTWLDMWSLAESRVPGHAPPRAHHGAGAGRPVDRRPGVLPERRPRHSWRVGLDRQAPRARARRPLPPPARRRPRGTGRSRRGVGRPADLRIKPASRRRPGRRSPPTPRPTPRPGPAGRPAVGSSCRRGSSAAGPRGPSRAGAGGGPTFGWRGR